MKNFIYRVMDANFNRVREGLRVCEEFVRFFLNDGGLTEDFKKLRSSINKLYINLPGYKKLLFLSRDVGKDIGRRAFSVENKRSRLVDVFWANIQRAKEALRVLEEFSKLEKEEVANEFRRLRFKTYELEKKAFKKLETLFGPGQKNRR